MASAVLSAYSGGLKLNLQRGHGTAPSQGGEGQNSPEAESILAVRRPIECQILPSFSLKYRGRKPPVSVCSHCNARRCH